MQTALKHTISQIFIQNKLYFYKLRRHLRNDKMLYLNLNTYHFDKCIKKIYKHLQTPKLAITKTALLQ